MDRPKEWVTTPAVLYEKGIICCNNCGHAYTMTELKSCKAWLLGYEAGSLWTTCVKCKKSDFVFPYEKSAQDKILKPRDPGDSKEGK